METVTEPRDIPFVKETKPADSINPVASKLVNKPSKIHINLPKVSPNEKRSVGFNIPEGLDNSQNGSPLALLIGADDDSTIVSTPIDEFFLDSPTASSIDISVRDLNSDILVALVDRKVEIKDLFVRNQDYFDFVKQTAFSSNDRWQEFLDVLFSPRGQIPDFDWMNTISELLIYTCGTDNPIGDMDIASIRDYPKSLEYLEKSYPQFFENAHQILSRERHRKGSFLGGNHLTDDIPLQSENDMIVNSNNSVSKPTTLYDEFKRILLCPRSEMDDVEWDISIYELLDPWPQLVAQFEEIIAHEINE
ncbi:306_t:CDS:2 [Cetraspora pellucida]|uniref:306_t:CDS:1 n=1 Tax=Cetraspora pellucida TaxID=1433469 RepID=A0A9N9IFE9_9GLOM|nr:306_t:CDS:2 [Cetraspora pellucida]